MNESFLGYMVIVVVLCVIALLVALAISFVRNRDYGWAVGMILGIMTTFFAGLYVLS